MNRASSASDVHIYYVHNGICDKNCSVVYKRQGGSTEIS